MTIFGVDLSDYDRQRGPVDVVAMARDGIQVLTHKATEGTSIKHAYYGQTLNAARAAGIPLLGAYMVPRTPGNNGHGSVEAQVGYFLAYLDEQTPWWRSTAEFFLQVDTEHWGYDDVDPAIGAQACTLIRAATGKWVVHYAPRWAYGDTIPGDDPLWASSYGSNPAVPYRQAYPGDGSSGWTPYSGRTPIILQFGSRVTIGTQPSCDGSAFRGSIDQLRALITRQPAPTIGGEEDDPMQPIQVAEGFVHMRDAQGKELQPADWSKETKFPTSAYGNGQWANRWATLGLACSEVPVDVAVVFGDGKTWVGATQVRLDSNFPGRRWIAFPPAATGDAFVVSVSRVKMPDSDPRAETAPVTAVVEVLAR